MHEGAFYMQKWFILHPECTRVHFTCKSKAQMHPECTRVHFTCKSKAQMHPECTRVHFTCKNYLICTQNARECILHAKVRHKCTQNARGCILHAKVRHKMHARCTHFDNIYFCKGTGNYDNCIQIMECFVNYKQLLISISAKDCDNEEHKEMRRVVNYF